MSGVSEQANGQASGLVLQSEFLFFLDHSAMYQVGQGPDIRCVRPIRLRDCRCMVPKKDHFHYLNGILLNFH